MREKTTRQEVEGSLVLDSGILLSFVEGKYPEIFSKIKNREIKPILSALSLAETYYVICRTLGVERAQRVVNNLVNSGLFKIVGISRRIISEAGRCKCKYAISLADCITIATAKVMKTKALFIEEKELKDLNIPEVVLLEKSDINKRV